MSETDAETEETGTKRDEPVFDRRMLEALVCPLTQSRLVYDAGRAELVSEPARLAFPIRDGIPIMLPDEARPLEEG